MNIETQSAPAHCDPDASTPGREQGHNGDLKNRTARGAFASFVCQGLSFVLRIGSMMILARLLIPRDFGLVGMVTAVTGFLAIFKEAGLANASVQSSRITEEQFSMLFWLNVTIGVCLCAMCVASADLVANFYGEPKLRWITIAAGMSFIFNGLAAQHRARLQRDLRIPEVGAIELLSLAFSIAISIAMAAAGFGYWALVSALIILPAFNALGVWLVTAWVPSRPRLKSGVRHLLAYGGTVTLNSVVVYLAYNVDKLLLGRFLGAEALGIYGRAYSLIDLPINSLHTTVGLVAFPALSRVQEDPTRLRRYFLRIYSLFLTLTVPITTACALFAEDIVRVALGPQWHDAASAFRLLAPTILVFAVINPLGWLMFATGHVLRSLKIALLIAPVVMAGYLFGLGKGPAGVAAGFSIAMILLMAPVVIWARHGTLIKTSDAFRCLIQPLGAILIAATVVFITWPWVGQLAIPMLRLTVASSVLFGVYGAVLLFVFGQKAVYLELLQQTGLWPSRTAKRGNKDGRIT